MTKDKITDKKERLIVGLMIVNADKHVFVGRRFDCKDTKFDSWQMPQGGIDPGEIPSETAFREMKEEIGCNNADIIAESTEWYSYQFPKELQSKLWNGHFDGNKQRWFLMRFRGQDADINLNLTDHPEFIEWKWVHYSLLTELIVPFKREVYTQAVQEFSWYFES
ncbi:MAG: RNA pyrophosphohydrolase [Alphaproteobacteria bacterium]|nr:RNA pyrophosphohydrolase [Alphaproteobacteria bacterium]